MSREGWLKKQAKPEEEAKEKEGERSDNLEKYNREPQKHKRGVGTQLFDGQTLQFSQGPRVQLSTGCSPSVFLPWRVDDNGVKLHIECAEIKRAQIATAQSKTHTKLRQR